MRVAIPCLATLSLTLAGLATPAAGQDANYWTTQYGPVAQLLGGQVVGSTRDGFTLSHRLSDAWGLGVTWRTLAKLGVAWDAQGSSGCWASCSAAEIGPRTLTRHGTKW